MSPVFDETKYRALLEKLEISVLTYSEICKNNNTYRWDSEYFLKAYLAADVLIRNRKVVQLNSVASIKGGKRLPLFATFSQQGSPYVRAEDVKNGFIHWEESPKISFEIYQSIKQYQLKYNDLLLTIVGNSIGDVGICKFDISPCNFTENCVKITNNNVSEYLFSFLLSHYGQIQIAREQVGTAQPKLAIERIRTFLIPQFDQQFYNAIKTVIDDARKKEEASIDCYKKSENGLLADLNLTDWQPDDESVATKTFADFQNSGRLDAEYYQPKYQAIAEKLTQYSNGTVSCANVLVNAMTKLTADTEYCYLELADIGKSGEINSCTQDVAENLPSRARQKVKTNDVIVSTVEGSLASCALITEEFNNAICSTGFHVLRSAEINPETLLLLMKSSPVQALLKQGCSGTILTAILPDALKAIKLPLIRKEVQNELAAKVQESFALRKESKRLLDLAKHAVEVAIEQGEDAAIKLLERCKDA